MPGFNGERGMSLLAFILACFTLFVMLIITAMLIGSSDPYESEFGLYAGYQAMFAAAGVSWMIYNAGGFHFKRGGPEYFTNTVYIFMAALVGPIAVEIIIRGTLERAAISTIVLAFYYVFAGAGEELLFRLVIIGSANRFSNRNLVVLGIAIVSSSLAFMFSHWAVYGQDLSLMLSQLSNGLIWGFLFAYNSPDPDGKVSGVRTGDIFPLLLAHMTHNVFALPGVLAMV
jgi:hypothetical protein